MEKGRKPKTGVAQSKCPYCEGYGVHWGVDCRACDGTGKHLVKRQLDKVYRAKNGLPIRENKRT